VLDEIVRERGVGPEFARMDNGPEMTADARRDWCHFGHRATAYIERGRRGRTSLVELFDSRVLEVLAVEGS